MAKEEPRSKAPSVLETQVRLVGGSDQAQGGRSANLLRSRLRTVALIIELALFLFLLRTPIIDPPGYIGLQVGALAVVGLLLVLLHSSVVLNEPQLRWVETILLAAVAMRLATQSYLMVRDRALAGSELLALGEMYNTVIAFAALIVLYGLVMPNSWLRTLLTIIPVALAPLVAVALMRALEPEASAALGHVYQFETLTNLIMAVAVASVVSVSGCYVMHGLRRQAAEANELGQYHLEDRIATGGMGEIWRANHRFLARPAAIKVIHPEKVDPLNPEAAAEVLHRFEREAQATAALESLHTVRIYDFGRTDQGDFYYAMELLVGCDLENMVKRHGPLPAARAIHFLQHACDSLAEAHHHGQVHRDIKPSNLYACKVGRSFDVVKVLDFGLVTRAGSEQARDARLNDEEELAGTPAYMAPEQVLAVTQVDERVDIYALGCVAYWLITGHTVFDIDRPLAMAVAHVKAPPMPPSRRSEVDVPKDLERIIMQCLEKDPKRRPQSVEMLADMLDACADSNGWNQANARQWWQRHGDTDLQSAEAAS